MLKHFRSSKLKAVSGKQAAASFLTPHTLHHTPPATKGSI